MRTQTVDTQVLVIGSGPGGACAAARLAEEGWDVLLLEEGDDLPLDSAPAYSFEEMRKQIEEKWKEEIKGKMADVKKHFQ